MEIVDLYEAVRTETAGHSSKGNQLKGRLGDCWYKADHMGYEGLAEVVVSDFLKVSENVFAEGTEWFAEYEPAQIRYRDKVYSGCVSHHFLGPQEELVPVEKLFRQFTGRSLAGELGKIADVRERILYLVGNITEITGLSDFGNYVTGALEIDAVFLNEDRHTNNLAVIYMRDREKYRPCPYFDHGLSLYADTAGDFPKGLSAEECRKWIHGKPFSRDFDEQLDAAEELYGKQIRFRVPERAMGERMAVWEGMYERWILERIREVLRQQVRKYGYLFGK